MSTSPETRPALALYAWGGGFPTFFTSMPADSMTATALSGLAFAMACTWACRYCRRETRTERFSSRAATPPLALDKTLVSASCRSSIEAWTSASEGSGTGNQGLFVIRWTIAPAIVSSRGTWYSGRFRATRTRTVDFAEVLISSRPRLLRSGRSVAGRRWTADDVCRCDARKRWAADDVFRCDAGKRWTADDVSRCDAGKRWAAGDVSRCDAGKRWTADDVSRWDARKRSTPRDVSRRRTARPFEVVALG